MSLMDTINKIKPFNESISYNEFYSCLSDNTVSALRSTTNYAKKLAINSCSRGLNESVSMMYKDYEDDIKESCDKMVDSYMNIINSEYNRLYTKVVELENIINANKKAILCNTFNCDDEIMLYTNFFKPNFDIMDNIINNPNCNCVMDNMVGTKSVVKLNDVTNNMQPIIDNISELKSQLIKNRNKLSKLIQTSGFSDFSGDDVIKLKDECKKYIDAFKAVNMAYDSYISTVESIIKSISNNRNVYRDNDLDNSIENEKQYDVSGIHECFNSIDNKIESMNIILENISIRYGVQTLNESTNGNNNSSGVKSRFKALCDAIIHTLKAIKEFIATKWVKIRIESAKIIDRYGKWANKNEEYILKNIKDGYDCEVTEWDWNGPRLDLSYISNAIKTMLPHRYIGSPIEKYESALKHFEQYSNGDAERNIYNMVMQKNFGIKTNSKVSINELWNKVIQKYKKGTTKKHIIASDARTYLNVLKNSKKRLIDLNSSDIMKEINQESDTLIKNMETVKSLLEAQKYTDQEYSIVMKYYNAKKSILDVAKSVANKAYAISFKIIQESTHDAYSALKHFTNKGLNESVDFSSNDYVKVADAIENNSDACVNSDLIDGGIFSKEANINNIISDVIPEEIMNQILTLKLYPICKFKNGSILLRSDLDKKVWIYDYQNKTLICQNDLNGVYQCN